MILIPARSFLNAPSMGLAQAVKKWHVHTDSCIQVDVECEYGYERHGEECRPIFGLESAKCAVLDRENYVISETKHRLIDGDSCKGLSQIIADTDGKGNLPGGHHGRHPNHGWSGATLFLIMLVRGPLRLPGLVIDRSTSERMCALHMMYP